MSKASWLGGQSQGGRRNVTLAQVELCRERASVRDVDFTHTVTVLQLTTTCERGRASASNEVHATYLFLRSAGLLPLSACEQAVGNNYVIIT